MFLYFSASSSAGGIDLSINRNSNENGTNPAKLQKYGKERMQKSIDKYLAYTRQSQMGRPMPNMDHEGRLKQLMAIADVKFMKNGQNIPANRAIAGAKEWWASLDKTNQNRNARIAKQRAPQG